MAKTNLLAAITMFLIAQSTQASIEIGVGTTSGTAGRIVPALAGGISTSSWAIFASSTGAANNYYYHSTYQFSYYWMFSGGTMWGGKISPGVGVGTMYTVRSFMDEGSTVENNSSDFALGPSLRMHWIFFDSAYIGIDALWGVRSLNSLASLAFQDYACLSIGAQLW